MQVTPDPKVPTAWIRRVAVAGPLMLAVVLLAYGVRTYFVGEMLTFRVGPRLFVQVGSRTPDWLTVRLSRSDPAEFEMAGPGFYERFDLSDSHDDGFVKRLLGSECYWDPSNRCLQFYLKLPLSTTLTGTLLLVTLVYRCRTRGTGRTARRERPRRLFTIAAATSLTVMLFLVAASVRSHWRQYIVESPGGVRIFVEFDTIEVSSSSASGKWRCVSRSISDISWGLGRGTGFCNRVRFAGFGILSGDFGDDLPWDRMTFVPISLLAAAAAVLPAWWLTAYRRGRPRPAFACRRCGYDLRGTPDRCPECGTPAA